MGTLFGYTLEEQDGKLVITVQGAFAETVIGYLREEFNAGRGLGVIERLSPLGPLRGVVNRHAAAAQKRDAREEEDDGLLNVDSVRRALDQDEILNQGIDQTLDDFHREMARFREAMRNFEQTNSDAQ